MLDDYLNKIQGSGPTDEVIHEGVLTSLNSFFVLLGIGKPKDRRVEVHRIAYSKCASRCWQAHPGERTTTTRKSRDYDQKQTDNSIDGTVGVIYPGAFSRKAGASRIFHQCRLTWLWPHRGRVGRVPTK